MLQRIRRSLSPTLTANILIILTMLAWGTSYISTKIIIAEIPPFTLAFLRLCLTSLILWPIFRKFEPTTRLAAAGRRRFAITGLLGITLYFSFENMGLRFTTASNASIIASLAPIMAIALNFLLFKVRLAPVELGAIAFGIIGSYLTITAGGSLDLSSANFHGNMLVIGAMVCWCFYTIFSKKQQNAHSDLAIVTYQTLFGMLLLIPLALTEYHEWRPFSLASLAQLIYLAAVCSAACYFCYIYALKVLDVAVTTLYLNIVPITGVITGYLVLNETIYASQLVGGLLIVLAIVLANLAKLLKFFQKNKPSPSDRI